MCATLCAAARGARAGCAMLRYGAETAAVRLLTIASACFATRALADCPGTVPEPPPGGGWLDPGAPTGRRLARSGVRPHPRRVRQSRPLLPQPGAVPPPDAALRRRPLHRRFHRPAARPRAVHLRDTNSEGSCRAAAPRPPWPPRDCIGFRPTSVDFAWDRREVTYLWRVWPPRGTDRELSP